MQNALERNRTIDPLRRILWRYCESDAIRAKTVTLKVKYADFTQITRAQTGERPFLSAREIEETIGSLLKPVFPPPKGVRLLGVTLSSLEQTDVIQADQLQLTLWRGG
ncbi:DinB/UmuC family translesion DNA polymerase [Rhizobium sp. S152]|uniref:DinB/UmuC family translesion DNA polymerase n=1 Tax=Rhizobium sp. S152 TaxID=3055038 RepID=UPI003FA6A6B8